MPDREIAANGILLCFILVEHIYIRIVRRAGYEVHCAWYCCHDLYGEARPLEIHPMCMSFARGPLC